MAYKKVGWKDYPSTDTPINATNLDHMDAGILENAQTIGDKTKISGIGDGTVAGAIAANTAAIEQNTQSLTKLFTVVNFHTYNGEQWVDVPLPDGWKTGNTAIIAMRVGNYITPTVNNKSMYECFVKDENTYMIIGRDTTAMNVDGHMVIAKI